MKEINIVTKTDNEIVFASLVDSEQFYIEVVNCQNNVMLCWTEKSADGVVTKKGEMVIPLKIVPMINDGTVGIKFEEKSKK